MALVEPVPGEPAATATLGDERALVVADYHAGIEDGLRYEQGINLDSRADERRERMASLVRRTDPDRVVVLGDFMHSIAGPGGAERGEIEVLLESIDQPVTLVKGNHDGDIESWVDCAVTPGDGVRLGDVGFVHGHTWPSEDVLSADVVCVGHEHPCVRLEDSVGGSRIERVWLRGRVNPEPFVERYDGEFSIDAQLVVFPAFNDLTGGTWVNVAGQGFLAPFLPDGLSDGEAYLLDGTRLGAYDGV
ncbi:MULTISPECIES: metallophosphoesterase [unclassified Haladaptatus]|uniref:metallophosphoesterase n=1 Tax=unclassified Haladaptatus TaxID=2622732 RepID=UPI00209BDDEF|nr:MULTISPECIES: metallophosphoesterase [unclassified Haladaptatus]MCO8243848.1 metallophosphoesterase [Haladaptatus sp. AB643]MCO8253462.1 metallophosphoesterase [Haladaptatus sp. AB618]